MPDSGASTTSDDNDGRFAETVYGELRAIADACFRRQNPGHTLQPTALVNEAYLRIGERSFCDRNHFVSLAARAMRQILVDHARRRGAEKRGGGAYRVTIAEPAEREGLAPVDVIALDEALVNLAAADERQARVVELRFFGGQSVEEIANALGVSSRTVELDWRMAKAWLSRALA